MAIVNQRGEPVVVGARRSAAQSPVSAPAPRERSRPVESFPRIITVSREFGAGGSRVAARVAAELGFQLWDHELIAHLARRAEADVQLIRQLDERKRDLLDDVIATSIHGGRVSGGTYRCLLTRTIAELAERGGAVIVGRGANFLVSHEEALRVRVICPFRERVERYGTRERVEWARAARYVRSKDRERERFVRQLVSEDAADPSHYDLIVNTLDLDADDAARLVIAAYHARFQARERARDERRAQGL